MSKLPNMEQEKNRKNRSGGILLWMLFGILMVMLVGGGLALATYLGFIPVDGIADKARQIPIVVKNYLSKTAAPPAVDEMVVSEQPTESVPMDTKIGAIPPKQVIQPTLINRDPSDAFEKVKLEELKNISRLARLYASMKPEEAVPILKELDDAFVVNMLRKMEDEQAARILAMMEPQRAAKLTRLLSSVNKTAVSLN